jgi:hypothetical protein
MTNVLTLLGYSAWFLASAGIANADPILTLDGFGEVKFGSKLLKVEKALGEKSVRENNEAGCDYVTFKQYPGVRFMVEDGIVTRADANKSITNSLEITIGTPLEDVKKKFPAVRIEPHQYDPTGHYLIFKNKAGTKAIVMDEGEGKVTDIRGGLEPAVEYVEGCE